MLKIILALCLTTRILASSQNFADISFFDYQGQVIVKKLPYYIDPTKTQYGVKFMVNIYRMVVNNCKLSYDGETEEYFAAYFEAPQECKVSQLIKDAKSHGADFVFVDMHTSDQISDATKNKYKIPVFVIDENNVEDIFMLNTAKNYKRSLNIFFQMKETSQKQNFVDVQFYYIASYEYTKKFIDVLSHVHHKLKDRVRFVPHVVTFTSQSQEFIVNNCVGNGNYCAFDPESDDGSVTGQDVIMESVTQICIYKQGISQYFSYMKSFYETCIHKISKECSDNLMYQHGVNKKTTHDCVEHSFNNMSSNMYENENTILYEEKQSIEDSGLQNFPHIMINNQVYEGTMNQDDLLLSLCSSLHDETMQCRSLELYDDDDDFSIAQIIITHIALFLIGLVIMAFVCKYIAKRKYNKELSKAIGKYVTEYSNMKEEEKMVQLISFLVIYKVQKYFNKFQFYL